MIGLIVSSMIMCLASLVFRRAINPRFGSGLYDDDTGESSIMSNILHHRSIPADPVGIDWLKKLAVIVNRYDCMQAMYYRANCKILAMKNKNRKEFCPLLWPAYTFDRAHFFASFPKLMILHFLDGQQIFNTSEKDDLPKDIESHLPKSFICEHPIKSCSEWVTANSNILQTLLTSLNVKTNRRCNCKWNYLLAQSL